MTYKIIETTDGQHRGAFIDIDEGQKLLEMPDGDQIKISKIKPMFENYYKLISFNYVMILEAVIG